MSRRVKTGKGVRNSQPERAGGKRARTRERLLDVAAALFEARGISEVSLDEVAAHAGMTKGAIYGSFASKDDLVYAVTLERTTRAGFVFEGDAPVRRQLRMMVRRLFGQTPNSRRRFAFLAEVDLYALSREPLARRFIEFARQQHRSSADALSRLADKDELPLPPLEFSIVVHALLNGLLFQHACFPETVTEEVASKALEALIDANPRAAATVPDDLLGPP